MEYSYSKDINSSFNNTEVMVKSALMDVGFGVLTEIRIQDSFKLKLNIDFNNYKILGACNPTLAHEAICYEQTIGILMPCNIIIIDNEDGTTKIVFPIAESLLDITRNKEVIELSKKVDKLLKSAFNNIS